MSQSFSGPSTHPKFHDQGDALSVPYLISQTARTGGHLSALDQENQRRKNLKIIQLKRKVIWTKTPWSWVQSCWFSRVYNGRGEGKLHSARFFVGVILPLLDERASGRIDDVLHIARTKWVKSNPGWYGMIMLYHTVWDDMRQMWCDVILRWNEVQVKCGNGNMSTIIQKSKIHLHNQNKKVYIHHKRLELRCWSPVPLMLWLSWLVLPPCCQHSVGSVPMQGAPGVDWWKLYPPRNDHIPPWGKANHRLKSAGW